MEKYLYFRTDADVANDAAINIAWCWPVSSLRGFSTGSAATTLYLFFKPIYPAISDGDNNNFANNDILVLNVNDNSQQSVIKAITDEIAFGRKSMIVVADDCTNDERVAETSRYVSPNITSCGAAAFASSFN